jgi:eukaryotic-like serine/threonine-protein kinase
LLVPRWRHIAVRGYGNTVRILRAATLATKRVYRDHTHSVTGLAWSPKGQLVVSAHRTTAHIWNTNTGELVSSYTSQRLGFHSPSWAPDGKSVAAVGLREVAHVWRAATGRATHLHAGDYYSLAWSPVEDSIALGGRSIIEIWSPTTGAVELTLHCRHASEVTTLGWSPDGKRRASSRYLRGAIDVWDAISGEYLYLYQGHRDTVRVVAWSRDGLRIASCSLDGTVQIWSAETGTLLGAFRGHTGPVYALAWSPDGAFIASGSEDRTMRIWRPDHDTV